MAATDFDYLATRNEIIQDAFEIVGVKSAGQPLGPNELAQGVRTLQKLVKAWSNEHVFLWSFNEGSFATDANQERYSNNDGLTGNDLNQAIGLDSASVAASPGDTNYVPLEVVSFTRFLDYRNSQPERTGRPQIIAYKPSWSADDDALLSEKHATFYLYPTPDDEYEVTVHAVFPLKDFDTAAGSGNIPARFQEALVYCLADRLFDKYPGPMNERELIAGKAAEFFRRAKLSDVTPQTINEVESLFGRSR